MKSWFRSSSQTRNKLSLTHLKYLYTVLEKNTTVSENNRGLLVESLRSIAEILIWGDQNDSSVFDFFLEKNMLSYFLHIMRQKSGGSSFVCVQLLQTLNILFENIRNETSLYYLLSNNHVNSIIVHKFDFSDEDVMGYYVLFLKTLSLKLNPHTIHFFYNEHTHDFPLYTEAIKFFNHPESMVRIAIRTISLNVYRVENTSMLEFIRDRTAAPYFSNLVWFIGKHILELDQCLQDDSDANHQSQHRLKNLVDEHLDHLHYLNDILLLQIEDLNAVLTEHLLHKLFVPLYIFSLTPSQPLPPMARVTRDLAAVLNKVVNIEEINNRRVTPAVAEYLLSLVFQVVTHGPLVHSLAWVILNGDYSVFKEGVTAMLNQRDKRSTVAFSEPMESLEEALENTVLCPTRAAELCSNANNSSDYVAPMASGSTSHANKTDEEKMKSVGEGDSVASEAAEEQQPSDRPFLDICLSALDCSENDYLPLLALCLIYALSTNKGIQEDWLESALLKQRCSGIPYKTYLIDRLLNIISVASQPNYRVRLVTLDLCLMTLVQFVKHPKYPYVLSEGQRNILTQAQSQSSISLRSFYLSEEIFLDLFEDEYNEVKKSKLNVEFLCMDATILLPPTGTPMTGINFTRRLPCGDVEKARRAIRAYLYLRNFGNLINDAEEKLLPLTKNDQLVQIDNVLDLNNSDIIACTVFMKDNVKVRRFLAIDVLQLILVEPDTKLLGFGVAKLVGLLQDVEVVGDKDDSRALHLTIHRSGGSSNRSPILSAKFVFDDHIRCMAAKQRLTKGRTKARQKKMLKLAQLLEIQDAPPDSAALRFSPLATGGSGSSLLGHREHRPLFSVAHRVPGVASAFSPTSGGGVSRTQMGSNRPIIDGNLLRSTIKHPATPASLRTAAETGAKTRSSSPRTSASSTPGRLRSRESSPQITQSQHQSRMMGGSGEDIPLENLSRSSTPVMSGGGGVGVGGITGSGAVGKPIPIALSHHHLRNSPSKRNNSFDGGISVSSSPANSSVLGTSQGGYSGSPGMMGGSGNNLIGSGGGVFSGAVLAPAAIAVVSQETSFMGGPDEEEVGDGVAVAAVALEEEDRQQTRQHQQQHQSRRKGTVETV